MKFMKLGVSRLPLQQYPVTRSSTNVDAEASQFFEITVSI